MRKLLIVLCVLCTMAHGRVHRRVFRAFPPNRESLVLQNAEIDRLRLERIRDARELSAMIEREELVPIVPSAELSVAKNIRKENRAYCRPWTLLFLGDLSSAYYKQFGQPLQVNSAVRTVQVQRRLLRRNRNAAPIHGEAASSHLAGLTVDLQRRGLSRGQLRYIEWRLLYLSAIGKVIVEEELRQPCFHTMVSGEYTQRYLEDK